MKSKIITYCILACAGIALLILDYFVVDTIQKIYFIELNTVMFLALAIISIVYLYGIEKKINDSYGKLVVTETRLHYKRIKLRQQVSKKMFDSMSETDKKYYLRHLLFTGIDERIRQEFPTFKMTPKHQYGDDTYILEKELLIADNPYQDDNCTTA